MKKGVIIMGSARHDGNTSLIVSQLKRETGFPVINLLDYYINYFDYTHSHVNDDYLPLMQQLINQFDLFVFATPVYWYSMSAQLKTFFDRLTDLLLIKKELGRQLRKKDMAVISCGHSTELNECFLMPFKQTATYLGMNYIGDCYTFYSGKGVIDLTILKRIKRFAHQLK